MPASQNCGHFLSPVSAERRNRNSEASPGILSVGFVLSHGQARTENSDRSLPCGGESNKTVTIFGCRFARKSKKKLTRFAITIKRPNTKTQFKPLKLHYETKIHFTIRVF